MVIAIKEDSDIPIYLQIRNQIVQGIAQGKLLPGEHLPPVRALAEEIGINFMTVNKAYQLLKQEGYLISDRRKGARIREEFPLAGGLSAETFELLKQIVSEAQLRGVSAGEFCELCTKMYEEPGTVPRTK